MITVACVWWGTKFPIDYVINLKASIERNTTVDHKFVCFSDKDVPGIETKILKKGYDGWWNKLQLFDCSHGLSERVIYFDLDTLITGDLDWLFKYDGNFMGIEDVGSVNAHQPHLKNVLQSAVMSWKYYLWNSIWTHASHNINEVKSQYRGDGEFLHGYMNPLRYQLIQREYPGRLKSYKYQVYPNRPDDKTSIVCFHGRPNIIQAQKESITTPMATYKPQNWIKDYWRK